MTVSPTHTHSFDMPNYSGNSSTISNHTHTTNIPNYSGNSGSSTSHTHAIDVPNFTGNSGAPSNNKTGSTGAGNDFSNLPPFIGVVFLIQAI